MNHFKTAPIKLSDGLASNGLRDLQILRVGKFYNERYGDFSISEKMLSEMVSNFQTGIRGIVPALDYSHDSEGVAAGWFKELYLSEDKQELWAKIEMTPNGEKTLAEKEFGYLSAEFETNYQTNEHPIKKVGAVLLGAGLTNRPVIKQMKSAIQLSEGDSMDVKELQDKLSAAEAKMLGMEEKEKMLMETAGVDSLDAIMEMVGKTKKPDEALLAEKDALLAEKEVLESEKKELSEKLSLSEKALAETKKENTFTVMLSEGKVCVAQKEAFLKDDMVEFAKNASSLNLSEKGHGKSPEGESDLGAEDKILELAEKMSKENKLSLGEAISKVRKQNPELVKKLQEKK
jgi:phage I-like protein